MLRGIKESYGNHTARAVAHFFKNVDLPMPKTHAEFTETSDNGYLIFLNEEACVIRLTDHWKHPTVHHPLILKSLFSRRCGKLRADIFPGVETPVSDEDRVKLFKAHLDDGMDADMINNNNGGYIIKNSQKTALCIDTGDIYIDNYTFKGLRRSVINLAKHIQNAIIPLPAQNDDYQELQDNFRRAWPRFSKSADIAHINSTWTLCREKADKGILVRNWQSKAFKDSLFVHVFSFFNGAYKNVIKGSNNYAKARETRTASRDMG